MVEVDPAVYAQAAKTVDTAAGDVNKTLTSLLEKIGGLNGMAGTDQTAETFAEGYDSAAYDALNAIGDLVDMLGNSSDAIKVSGTNHAAANAASSGEGVDPAPAPPPRSKALMVCPYVSAKGSDSGGPSGILGKVWDAIQSLVGYIWPNGSPGKLREAGTHWNGAATSIGQHQSSIQSAIDHLQTQDSPEIPLAIAYLNELKTKYSELQTSLSDLGKSCNDLAQAIEDAHRELENELQQFAIEFAIGEVVFAILFEVGGEIWGNAAMAARATVMAGRCAKIIERLIELARTIAATAKRAGDAIKNLLTKLKVIKKAEPKKPPPLITANKAAGDAARDMVKNRYHPNARTEVTEQTKLGDRRIDILDGNHAVEVKLGRTSLTTTGSAPTRLQIDKDVELMKQGYTVEWVFTKSGTTGAVGPTKPLVDALAKAGIPWRIA
ncbi:hypothetical protein P5V65_08905 [Mycobacteroides abscessus subsp. abscessus]|uniref:WXG100-like domain-containing protein n=1 Tax=Mycobacteroides abscessus TaxID=36809 RepID=UPI00266BF7C6|nr:hypothetical protein [Mycobacteroides abscessus]MDO3019348.1 hypothetical protein [Mycobacteroides abscessus subsp. abscessus]